MTANESFGVSPRKTEPCGNAGKITAPHSLPISCFMAFFVVSLCWEPKGRTVPSDGQLFGGREQLSHEGFNGCNGNGNKGIAATILHKGVKILNLSSSKLPGKRLHPPVPQSIQTLLTPCAMILCSPCSYEDPYLGSPSYGCPMESNWRQHRSQ